MCKLCDLAKEDFNDSVVREQAQEHVKDVIRSAEVIARKYHLVLEGRIKPHTQAMTDLVSEERYLIRLLIIDVLT